MRDKGPDAAFSNAQRQLLLYPDDDTLADMVDRARKRTLCQCLKKKLVYYILDLDESHIVLRSRWLDTLQQPFSRLARKYSSDWADIRNWKPTKWQKVPPIACRETLEKCAERYVLLGQGIFKVSVEETLSKIYGAKTPYQIRPKIPAGMCRRCGLEKGSSRK